MRPPARRRADLTAREREIVGMLAEGLSGAEIAAKLVLSPETVRTHIRNAMAKLGASTRSQAVVLAIQGHQLAGEEDEEVPPGGADPNTQVPAIETDADRDLALEEMLRELCGLHDIDAAVAYLAEEDGLSLRRAACAAADGAREPGVTARLALGEGPLGRIALNRRAAVIADLGGRERRSGTALAAPIVAGGKLLGVVGISIRTSRPAGQGELLVMQAFVNRVGEILAAGTNIARQLETTVERFSASWSATAG